MSNRMLPQAMVILAVGTLLVLAWSTAGVAGSAPSALPVSGSDLPVINVSDADLGDPIRVPDRLDQIGIVQIHCQNFEDASFPSRASKWTVADRCAIYPGRRDIIGWGRTECGASAGAASLWSVGGGDVGKTLGCDDPYPASVEDPRRTCSTVTTLLRYTTFNFSNVQYSMKVYFDLWSKMPAGALRVAIGERDDNGNINFTSQFADFTPNTAGQWEVGVGREFVEAAGLEQVVLGFFYIDEAGSADMQGARIDNVCVYAVNERGAAPPSPTTPAPPTNTAVTPTVTPVDPFRTPDTPTPGPTFTPTPTPRPVVIQMPAAFRGFKQAEPTNTPRPTLPPTLTPTPTLSPTTPPTITSTPRPSRTPAPTNTPTRTPRPSSTPVPKPEVVIADIMFQPEMPGTHLEIVSLENIGTAEQMMDGWRLFNASHNKSCRFTMDMNVTLQAGETYEIRSGSDAATNESGFECDDGYIWDNRSDEAQLFDEFNRMKDCYAYDEDGPYNCMPTE